MLNNVWLRKAWSESALAHTAVLVQSQSGVHMQHRVPFQLPSRWWHRSLWLLVALGAQPGFAAAPAMPPSVADVMQQFPVSSINSVEIADAAIAAVLQARAEVNKQYAIDERACAPQFFAASCLDHASEKRRQALGNLRPIEVTAERFKRQQKVQQRDLDLAQKQREHALQAPERLLEAQKREQDVIEREKKVKTQQELNQEAIAAAQRAAELAKRQEEAAAKVRERAAKQGEEAKMRAEKVAEFDKKQEAAAQRQRDLAKRQQERKEQLAAEEKAKLDKLEKEQSKAKAAVGTK